MKLTLSGTEEVTGEEVGGVRGGEIGLKNETCWKDSPLNKLPLQRIRVGPANTIQFSVHTVLHVCSARWRYAELG